jgi:predicted aconitase with swiveling domain
MAKTGKGPKALVLQDCEAIVAVGCIIADLPCIDQIDISKISTGMNISINADEASLEIN